MTKRNLLGVLIGLISIGTSVESSGQGVEWSLENGNEPSYGVGKMFYNGTRQLGYESRRFGVNLGWSGHDGGWFEFRRWAPAGTTDHRRGDILPEDNVAWYSSKARQYLVYKQRGDTEAELGWSRTPSYQWQVRNKTNNNGLYKFALYNTKVNKYLVYQVKNYGINLGWLGGSTSGGGTSPMSFSVGMSAQQTTGGWIPYLGTFGQNSQGNLLTVQNASQVATLMFIKPGKSTTDCGDPNATLRVAPRAAMSPDQMKMLYGAATPRLPINFLACITTQAPQNITLTFLNVTYKLDH